MFPADRDPPVYAPPPVPVPAPRAKPLTIENPFAKTLWTKDDLLVVSVLAQLSSGRSGDDAVERAKATIDLLMRELA